MEWQLEPQTDMLRRTAERKWQLVHQSRNGKDEQQTGNGSWNTKAGMTKTNSRQEMAVGTPKQEWQSRAAKRKWQLEHQSRNDKDEQQQGNGSWNTKQEWQSRTAKRKWQLEQQNRMTHRTARNAKIINLHVISLCVKKSHNNTRPMSAPGQSRVLHDHLNAARCLNVHSLRLTCAT